MAEITWKETPLNWTAECDGKAVCSLKKMDIGGWAANWLNGHKWPAPAHMPKAQPQPMKFFPALEEAKTAVEHALK